MRYVPRSVLMTLLATAGFLGAVLGAPVGTTAATEVTIWTAFPDMHESVVKMAEKYMKENPNIKITATLFPQRAQEEKVAVALPPARRPT